MEASGRANGDGRIELAGIHPSIKVGGVPALLTVKILLDEAIAFAKVESKFHEPSLYGVTDGKAVGTYLEHKFQADHFERVAMAASVFQGH
jgi:hypothetical protein